MDGAASDRLVAPTQCRIQSAGAGCDRWARQPRSRAQAGPQGRQRQRADDQGAARRQSQPVESHWQHTVPDGGQVGRRAAHARAARDWRQSRADDQPRDHRVDGRGWCRHLGAGREPGYARGSAGRGEARA